MSRCRKIITECLLLILLVFIFLYIKIYILLYWLLIFRIFNYPKCSTHLWSVVLVQKKYLPKFTISQEVYFHTSKCTFHPDLIWHQKWKSTNYLFMQCTFHWISLSLNDLSIKYLHSWISYYRWNIFISYECVLSMKCI